MAANKKQLSFLVTGTQLFEPMKILGNISSSFVSSFKDNYTQMALIPYN